MVINYILPDGSYHQIQDTKFIPQKGDTIYFDMRYYVTLTEYVYKQKPHYYELTEINIHLEKSDE